jgi:3-phenylpropionate/cinnamic acid dioxygenase small subunit
MDPLQYLLDKHAIEQVYVRYCELIDAKDFARLDEVFTPDTIGDYTQTYGAGAVREGLPVLIELMTRNLGRNSGCGPTQHNVGNFRITVDGDAAESRVNFYAVHRSVTGAAALFSTWGEYHDSWLRTAAGWRIRSRHYRTFLTEGSAATLFSQVEPPHAR